MTPLVPFNFPLFPDFFANLSSFNISCGTLQRAQRILPRGLKMFSSPPTTMRRDESLIIISSSPEFPSICDLIPKTLSKNPTTLRSGKNAASIPGNASTTFTSATTMWREARQVKDEGTPGLEVEASGPVLKEASPVKPKPDSRATTKPTKKKAARPVEVDPSVMVGEPSESNASAPKKRGYQAKPPQGTTQTIIGKGKVIKPVAKEKVMKKKVETVSRHFAIEPSISKPLAKNTPEAPAPTKEDELVILEPAMRRRFDWTPPLESLPREIAGASSTTQAVGSPVEGSICTEESPEANVFKALHDTFGLKSDDVRSVSSGSGTSSVDVLGKRKLIEMVQTAAVSIAHINANGKALAESLVKSKAVKKKPRTITELATAAYRQQEEPLNQESLLSYLDTSDAPTGPSTTELDGKGKAGRKPAKPRASKKKPEPKKPILLSPESALRQVAQQDFLFGTSSQLATEDDPELLRALHEAMNLSNDATADPFAIPSPVTSGLVARKKPGRLLWEASARDEDGELLDMGILDLTESPPPPHSQPRAKILESLDESVQIIEDLLPPPPTKEPQPMKETLPPSPGAEDQRHTGYSIFDFTDSSADTEGEFHSLSKPTVTKLLVEEIPAPNDADWDDDVDFELPPSNQEHHELLLTQSSSLQLTSASATTNPKFASSSKTQSNKPSAAPFISSPQSRSMDRPRPKYELFTDAQLARDIANFGFKPVKTRSAMIALLDQCWASRVQPATGGVDTNVLMRATTATSQAVSKLTTAVAPSSPQGRPRKNSGTAPVSVDYGSLKVLELKTLLQERGLKQSGNKPDLIARLQDHDLQMRASAGGLTSPRGRPRKDAASSPKRTKSPARRAAFPGLAGLPATTLRHNMAQGRTAIIEIPDSDADSDLDGPMLSSPVSSVRRARPGDDEDIFPPPPRVDLSINEDAEMSLVASPTTEQVSVFAYITKAITSAPPSTDPSDPSWYEKILMYDSIILEDLASWLNAGQLDKVGFDGEVSPGDVKQWCQSKSVCSCKRECAGNKRNRSKPRFTVPSFSTSPHHIHRKPFDDENSVNEGKPGHSFYSVVLFRSSGCVVAHPFRLSHATRSFSLTTLVNRPLFRASGRNFVTTSINLNQGPLFTKAKTMDPKLYTKSAAPSSAKWPPPSPSASILLISPTNKVLLLKRVKTASSFASAHVFPGGNVDEFHDGVTAKDEHLDNMVYRNAAIRETFEETGILLSKDSVEVSDEVRDNGRKDVYNRQITFDDWVKNQGGLPDTDSLVPFTRWITPPPAKKRFTTQMYLYFLPVSSINSFSEKPSKIHTPTPEGEQEKEHTSAEWEYPLTWLSKAKSGKIMLYPPQFYLLHLLSPFLNDSNKEYAAQRAGLGEFLQKVPTSMGEYDKFEGKFKPKVSNTHQIAWADKVISPSVMFAPGQLYKEETVLSLEWPGPELGIKEGNTKGGDAERVVVVEFERKYGPRGIKIVDRGEVRRLWVEKEKKGAKI
ncbi:hypothetical protein QBC36DRAFT_390722 [Triangularia setosa]|uniref:Structure-specific endonuclease subunit SLX4 n=1 Tax=Triangularia setosa TaxID=2587417 RepID=A0AAN6W0M4_9PEZI|nr:hypothetical protein QBC36DRAFT_390722 [Podospora setosa]